jgi:CubicO group peptidase (beta-lactamase class C family)
MTALSFLTLLLAAGAGYCPLVSASVPEAGSAGVVEVARQIQAAIDEEIDLGFSGAVLVAQGDRVLVDEVYGSLKGKPLPPEGRFLIASAAKQFTSTALVKLQELGRLDLDKPIGQYFANAAADKRSITIRQLLSHTSGLPQGYDSESAVTWQEAAQAILNVPLTAASGEKFQYSNENYQLGVALVEAVSGRNYAEFVRDELLQPAGLHDTGQLDGPSSVEKLSPTAGSLPPRLLRVRWGGFGYYTTAHDFFCWYRAVRSGGLLTSEGVAELFTPIAKTGEGYAALGWFTGTTASGEERVFTRGNDDVGSNSAFYAYPGNDTVIVVLSHAGQKSDEISWARAVHSRIEEILFGDPGK